MHKITSGLVGPKATEGTLRTDVHPSRGQPERLLKIMSGLAGLKLNVHRGQPDQLLKIMSDLVGLTATEGN